MGPFAEALERLRRDRDPDEERVVPIGPHQVNDRVRRLAARAGGASTTSVQLAGGWRTPAGTAPASCCFPATGGRPMNRTVPPRPEKPPIAPVIPSEHEQ